MQSVDRTHELRKLITRLYDQTPLIGWKRRRDAAVALAEDESPEAIDALADALIRSHDEQVRRIALKALLELAAENRIEAQEALCHLVIEHDHPLARKIVLAAQYVPREPQQQALFYFLTEQWEKYEQLDFNQNLLRAAYGLINDNVRKRVAECARQSGHIEWLNVLVSERQEKRQIQITEKEWEAILALLSEQHQWEKLWELAQEAPAMWSVRMLLRLKETSWMPSHKSEQSAFLTLVRLAEVCYKIGSPGQMGYCDASLKKHTGQILDVAISLDGQILLSTGEGSDHEHTVCLWNLPKQKLMHTLNVWATRVFIRPDGRTFITSGATIDLWSLPDGARLRTFLENPSNYANRGFSAMSPDGQMLVGHGYAEPYYFITVGNLSDLHSLQINDFYFKELLWSRCLVFSPDGQMLAGQENRTILVSSVSGGHLLYRLEGHSNAVCCVAFSPDAQLLASGSEDATVLLWNLSDRKVLKALEGHTEAVTCLAFSPDGQVLASGSNDKMIRLWLLPEGTLIQTLTGHTDQITCLTMSPDGKLLASGSRDTSIRLWTLRLVNILHLPISQITTEDLQDIEEMLQQSTRRNPKQQWLKFLLALIRWHRRYDIDVAETIEGIPRGEFDIEIDA